MGKIISLCVNKENIKKSCCRAVYLIEVLKFLVIIAALAAYLTTNPTILRIVLSSISN